jgi:hypothetical protein
LDVFLLSHPPGCCRDPRPSLEDQEAFIIFFLNQSPGGKEALDDRAGLGEPIGVSEEKDSSFGVKLGKEELEEALIIMAGVGGFHGIIIFAEVEEADEVEGGKQGGGERVDIGKEDLVALSDPGVVNDHFDVGGMLAFRGGDGEDLVALRSHRVAAPEEMMFAAAEMEDRFTTGTASDEVLEKVEIAGAPFPIQSPGVLPVV